MSSGNPPTLLGNVCCKGVGGPVQSASIHLNIHLELMNMNKYFSFRPIGGPPARQGAWGPLGLSHMKPVR